MTFIEYLKSKVKLIAVLTLGGIVMTYFVCNSCLESWKKYTLISLLVASMWIILWLGNEFISHVLDEKIPWTKKPITRLVMGAIAVIVYSVSATFVLVKLFEIGFSLNIGVVNQLYVTVIITIVITIIMTSRSFLFNWRQSAIDAEKLQKESIAARYESLKNQVNPHFLFNSFNALTNLVYEDQDKAAKFIKQLSEVYRYVLDTRDKEVVPIEEELKFLKSYIFLQQIRFGEKLKIEIEITNAQAQVAPLALQMLIENALKHNVASEDDPLFIKLYSSDDYIVVENNIQKKTSYGEPSAGVGLENIRNRYDFLSNRKVEIIQNDKKFLVKLPALTKN